ncbi:hypothetical protein OXIME_000875 [Oxyplasma meridianum]|uniref:Uncharacterized protein n=1 Tax=Oxyplasma meridianum TaxID=3073602 RepID=A0AAX4NFW0_9ARCH
MEKSQNGPRISFQEIVGLLVTKIDDFENMYRRDLTKIMGNLEILNFKMDYIYKIFENEDIKKKGKIILR